MALQEVRPHPGIGSDNDGPRLAIKQHIPAISEVIDVDTHNHRYAPRSREDGDVARGAAPPQYQPAGPPNGREKQLWATGRVPGAWPGGPPPPPYQPAVAPIGSENHRWRHVVCRDDHARWHDLVGFTC